ncbi:MAG: hypothetical protein A2297_03590 [Elusimicrobia bacterium RIFOXYB2_FULL_48_7]|nr:MAG: hypothetical protein A2297_03590 [Elusimicrobia bacterium RIFOXYB2_FULL_48_7]
MAINNAVPKIQYNADFAVALSRGGKVKTFPFYTGEQEKKEGSRHAEVNDTWRLIDPRDIRRTLTPCIDEFSTQDITLKVYTPHPGIPDPENNPPQSLLKYAVCPVILMEITIDNSKSGNPAYGFIGLKQTFKERLRRLDWSTGGKLCGVAYTDSWALAAKPVKNKVWPVMGNDIAQVVENGSQSVHASGYEGGIMMKVLPRRKETLVCSFGFYRYGEATQVIKTEYLYTKYFKSVEEVCAFGLDSASRIKKESINFDRQTAALCPDQKNREMFAQSVRAYYANTQLAYSGNKYYYNIGEGGFFWRNTMDLAADHLPWELCRNPWVTRNIMDLYIDRYSYVDRVRFLDEPGKTYPGGLSFTHDMGNFTTYSPKGVGGYERANVRGCYGFMTTEELLNGIYCFAGYALSSKDIKWAKKRKKIAGALLESMENRDHHDPSKRDGILKAESLKCGDKGSEITTYDCLDASLLQAQGNLYIVVKTWCSALMLEKHFEMLGDKTRARRAREFACKTAASLVKSYNPQTKCLPANILGESKSKLIAAIEPLAVPYFLGLGGRFKDFPELMGVFKKHIETCLLPGNCSDAVSGGLRLSSLSTNTWPSKANLCLFVIKEVFGINIEKKHPALMENLIHWVQVAAAAQTISDQVLSDKRTALQAIYYPRIVTSFLWIKNRLK